jgi:hypothetical protein
VRQRGAGCVKRGRQRVGSDDCGCFAMSAAATSCSSSALEWQYLPLQAPLPLESLMDVSVDVSEPYDRTSRPAPGSGDGRPPPRADRRTPPVQGGDDTDHGCGLDVTEGLAELCRARTYSR